MRIFLFKIWIVMVLEQQHIWSGLHIYDEIRYLTIALKRWLLARKSEWQGKRIGK